MAVKTKVLNKIKPLDPYISFYEYISSVCKKDHYNLVLHRHIGDSFILVGFKKYFEEYYEAPLHYIIPPSQEFLMELYKIENYSVVDLHQLAKNTIEATGKTAKELDKLEENIIEKLFPSFPTKDIPFIASFVDYVSERNPWKNFVHCWSVMLGLDVEKIDLPPMENYPELSEEALQKIEKIAPLDKIILFAPEAQSCDKMDMMAWEILANHFKKEGYEIITNAVSPENIVKGTHHIDVSLKDIIALGTKCHSVFSVRSGLSEILAIRQDDMFVFYPKGISTKDFCFYNMYNTSRPVNEIKIRAYGCQNIIGDSKKIIKLLNTKIRIKFLFNPILKICKLIKK